MKKIKALILVLIMALAFGFIACGKEPTKASYDLGSAKSYVNNMYSSKLEGATTGSTFTVVSQVVVKEVVYNVSWEVEVTKGAKDDVKVGETKDGATSIEINPEPADDVEYKLTAVIADPDKNTISLTYTCKVNKYAVDSWAEFQAKAKGDSTTVCGVVTGVFINGEKTSFYMNDLDGKHGYYVYNMTLTEASDLAIGNLLEVKGKIDIYNGIYEIIEAGYRVKSTGNNVEAYDVTEIWNNAKATTDAELVEFVSAFVTIKGVEMVDITDKYRNFKREDGLTSYLYISSSTNFMSAADTELFDERVVAGRTATVTGAVSLFNGAFYLIPFEVDAIVLDELKELNDAEKVEDAKKFISGIKDSRLEADINLPTTTNYEGVSIVWESSNTELLDSEGHIVAYPLEDTKVTLKATITSGAETATEDLEVTVAALKATKIADLDFSDKESTVIVQGKIIGFDKAKNFILADETGYGYVYTQSTPEDFKVGDCVKLIAKLDVYGGVGKNNVTKEIVPVANGFSKIEEEITPLAAVKVDLADFGQSLKANAEDTSISEETLAAINGSRYWGKLVTVYGYVTLQGTYNNPYITENADGTGAIVLYHYNNLPASVDTVKASAGKLVCITAPVEDYALDGNWRLGTFVEFKEVEAEEALKSGTNKCGEIAGLAKDTETSVVGYVTHVYSGNGFTLADETGGIYVYDKKHPALEVGDIVYVAGKVDKYNGVGELVSPSYEILAFNPRYASENEAPFLNEQELKDLAADSALSYSKRIRLEGQFVVSGNYINFKVGETTFNLYLSNDEKASVQALLTLNPEGLFKAEFVTYNVKNDLFQLFVDVNSIKLSDN